MRERENERMRKKENESENDREDERDGERENGGVLLSSPAWHGLLALTVDEPWPRPWERNIGTQLNPGPGHGRRT